MRVLSISFSLERGFGVFACYERTISTGNLLSQVGLARNLASRVAMLLQSDKNQAEIRPPLGRRAETGRKEGGEKEGGRAIRNAREKERDREKERIAAAAWYGQLSNAPSANESTTRRNSRGRSLFRDLSRYSSGRPLPRCTRLCRYPCTHIRAAYRAPRRDARKNSRGNAKMRFTGAANHGRSLRETSCYIR